MEAFEDAAVVSAEAPIVFCVVPRNGVGKRVGLIQFAACRRVRQAAKGCEADSRQPPGKRVRRNSGDARETSHVCYVRIKVCGRSMIVVVIHPQAVGQPPFAVNPTRTGVQTLRAVAASQGRKRIHNVARAARPVQPEIDIVVRAPGAPASSFHSTGSSENDAAPPGPGVAPKLWTRRNETVSELLFAEVT